jgi:hypothetical protein
MKTYKSIERKSIILGMPVEDIMLLLSLLLGLVMLGGIMGASIKVSKLYYLISLLSVIALQFGLKYFNQKKHPTFIRSFISYYFLQVRRISIIRSPHKLFDHGKQDQ